MSSPLSFWQEFALVALGVVSFFYALVFRVWSGNGLAADGVFALAIAALVTVVSVPSAFDTAGAHVVEWSPLPKALAEADARTAELAALPGRLIDGALERLGLGPDPGEEPADGVEEEAGATAAGGPAPETGWLAARVRPSVDGLVALLLRVAAAALASLVLLLAVLLRIVTSLARRLRRIGERLEALETSSIADADGPQGEAQEIEPAR